MSERKLGLIINPIAGIGGRVGLKGSDGAEIQEKALALGAVPEAHPRTIQALESIQSISGLEILTFPSVMGEDAAKECGFDPIVIGSIKRGETTSEDTIRAAREMLRLSAHLLLFTGGDGTARDIYDAVGIKIPVLGIPAGVKIHSAVFGINPRSAGDLAALFIRGKVSRLREAEVMDIDEDCFRSGVVSARLYGYLKIPFRRSLVQSHKVASSLGEGASTEAIACDIIDAMEEGILYILGPGTTTRAITSKLKLEKTLIGVDVICDKTLVATDVNEAQLLKLVNGQQSKIIVTPIGGQGHIFGRGNQQISHKVIRNVGKHNIIVISTADKINSFHGQPLWIDTGDRELDRMLSGHIEIITGYGEKIIYRVSC